MTAFICFLLVLLLVAALAAAVVATVVQHTGKMRELCEHGVEAVATVERNELPTKLRFGPVTVVPKRETARRTIAYRYTDGSGAAHAGAYDFPASDSAAFAGLSVGDPLPIVYSSRKPGESAPARVVDTFRTLYPSR